MPTSSRPSAARSALLAFVFAAGCGGSQEPATDDSAAGAGDTDVAVSPGPGSAVDAGQAGPLDADDSGEVGLAALDAGGGGETGPTPLVTVVVLPDTQYYSASFPATFAAQTGWIVKHKTERNIAVVLHVGDLVDNPTSVAQWSVANTSMHALDGVVPYVLVPGNHDTDINRQSPIDNYFAPATMPWIAGTMTAGQIENNYALVDIGPQQWLVLGLEFGPRDAVVTWADSVLKAYANLPAILVTHAYLYGDGKRYDVAVSGLDSTQTNFQWFIPQYYGYTASQGINDGEELWQKLVLPNKNVRLVFCGHDSAAARLTSTRSDGSRVHQMLSDYQWLNGPNNGFGYLRTLEFDYDKKEIRVQTYSPSLDLFLTDDANQFALSLEL
jgi:3',5'-cyclic AMP phosphodiesterase CpdA